MKWALHFLPTPCYLDRQGRRIAETLFILLADSRRPANQILESAGGAVVFASPAGAGANAVGGGGAFSSLLCALCISCTSRQESG